MTTQNLTIAATSSHDGYGATAIGLQDNATVMDSGKSGSWEMWIWARFQVGAAIAQSSAFTVANFSLKATNTDSSTTWAAEIVVEKVANAANVTGAFSNLSSRTFTTAKTVINNDATTANTYKTWDIGGAIQELVNTYGIASGDYILVAVRYVTSTTTRRFYQRDNGAGDTPKLDLTYADPPIQLTATVASVFTTAGNMVVTLPVTATAAAVFSTAGHIGNTRQFSGTIAAAFKTGGREVQKLVLPKLLENGEEWDEAISFSGSFVELNILADLDSFSFTSGDFNTFAGLLQAGLDFKFVSFLPAPVTSVETVSDGTAIVMTWAHYSGPTGAIAYSNHSAPLNFNGTYPTPYVFTYRESESVRAEVFRPITATLAASFTTSAAELRTILPITATIATVFTTSTAAVGVHRSLTATMVTVFDCTGSIVFPLFVTASINASFATSDNVATVIFCRLDARVQTVFTTAGNAAVVTRHEASIQTTFNTTAAASIRRGLTSTLAASFATAGHIRNKRAFTAVLAASFITSGEAGIPKPVTAVMATVFNTGAADLDHTRRLTATLATAFTTGTPVAKMPLTATLAASFNATGSAAVIKPATASLATVFTTAGSGTVRRRLTASLAAAFTTGVVHVGLIPARSTAVMAASFSTTARPTVKRRMTATVASVIQTNQPLMKVGLRITATVAASFNTASLLPTVRRVFTSTIAASFNTAAALNVNRKLSANISCNVSTSAAVKLTRRLIGSMQTVISTSGTIINRRKLTANVSGIFQTIAVLGVYRGLSAHVDVVFVTHHNPPYKNHDDLKEVWDMAPRDFAWILPEIDENFLLLKGIETDGLTFQLP